MVDDDFELRLPATEEPRHKRVNGRWCADYFCMYCGSPMSEDEEGHGPVECEPNPELVNELRRINLW